MRRVRGSDQALAAALEPVASSMAVSGVATFSSDWPSALREGLALRALLGDGGT